MVSTEIAENQKQTNVFEKNGTNTHFVLRYGYYNVDNKVNASIESDKGTHGSCIHE